MTLRWRTSAFILTAAAAGAVLHAQDARPLPSQEALFKAVQDNLIRAERIDYQYAFRERRSDLHTNPFGKLGTDGITVSEVYPSATPALTYRRVLERNGVPLTSRELAEQDREYQKRATEVLQQLAAEEPDARRRRDGQAERAAQRGQRRIADVINALQFKVEGRSVHEGVPAIVVTFTPKRSAMPETRQGRIAQKFSGTAWIDEAAMEVRRLEAKAIEDISFGYGLIARLNEGTVATVTRRPIDRDLWLPTQLTIKGRGRAAVFRTLVLDFTADWFDYRRLEGDSPTPFPDTRIQGQSGGRPQ
jgi:hypothetical protein